MEKPDCEECSRLHSPDTPPCNICEVVLSPELADFATLYLMVRDQTIGESNTISLQAIESAIRLLGEGKQDIVKMLFSIHNKIGKRS